MGYKMFAATTLKLISIYKGTKHSTEEGGLKILPSCTTVIIKLLSS